MTDGNLFKEIQEDLERQKLEALWRKFGPFVLAGAVTIVVAAGSISAWNSWKNTRSLETTDAWYQALTANKDDEKATIAALDSFAKAHGTSQQAALARLEAAALQAKRGEKAEAIATYDAIAGDNKLDPAIRQLAVLNAVRVEADTGDKKALLEKLQPLLKEGTPWRPAATELAGHLANATGDVAKARQYFSLLAQDATAPLSMTKRADSMLRFLSNNAPETPKQ